MTQTSPLSPETDFIIEIVYWDRERAEKKTYR